MARIDVGKGDGFRVHGKGQFERKVALLVASHTVVNAVRNQAKRGKPSFSKNSTFSGSAGSQFIPGCSRTKSSDKSRRMITGLLAVRRWRMFFNSQRPVDRVARYAARFPSRH